MIKAVKKNLSRTFFATEVWPRRNRVFRHRYFLVSIVVAIAVGCFASYLPTVAEGLNVTFGQVCTATLAFGALCFGASSAGALTVLTLQSDRLLAALMLNGLDDELLRVVKSSSGYEVIGKNGIEKRPLKFPKRSLYSDLLFTLLYSASIQMILALVSVVVLFTLGGSPVVSASSGASQGIALALLSGLSLYAILQLAAVVRSLAIIGRHRERFVRQELSSP